MNNSSFDPWLPGCLILHNSLLQTNYLIFRYHCVLLLRHRVHFQQYYQFNYTKIYHSTTMIRGHRSGNRSSTYNSRTTITKSSDHFARSNLHYSITMARRNHRVNSNNNAINSRRTTINPSSTLKPTISKGKNFDLALNAIKQDLKRNFPLYEEALMGVIRAKANGGDPSPWLVAACQISM